MLHGYLTALLGGALATLQIALCSLLVAIVFGILGVLARLSPYWLASTAARWYTSIVRGAPELVLLLFVFYGGQLLLNAAGAALGAEYIDIDPFAAGVATIGFIYGAYLTETFRGAIQAIAPGQVQAAEAIGMGRALVFRRIVLPQMIRLAIPGFSNNWLVLIKATALVSLIGMDDLMNRAGLAASATHEPLTFYVAAGVIYLGMTTVSIVLLRLLEKKYSAGVRRAEA